MAVITSAGTGDWDAGATWVGGTAPGTGDDAIKANTHTVTLTADTLTGSCQIQSGGTIAGGGFELECDDENGAGHSFDNDGIISGVLDVKGSCTTRSIFDLNGTSGNVRNLTIDQVNADQNGSSTIDGNLVVNSGKAWNANWSSNNNTLNIGGNLVVNGTIASSNWRGALTIGGRLEVSGTYNGASTQSITCGQIQIKEGATWSGPGIDKIDTDYVLSGSYPPELIGLTEHPRSINYKRVINYDRFINISKFEGM